jgi:uncharacterized protein with PIN domain
VSVAYIDSSCVVALAFGEAGARKIAAAARTYTQLIASNVLEAEVRAALARERAIPPASLFESISWVHPQRSLEKEMAQALAHGVLRGADLWHVACALYLDPTAKEIAFLTLDESQGRVAAAVGFKML